jgi:hypothetical protein
MRGTPAHTAPLPTVARWCFGRDAAVTIYHLTLRDRETQTVVGYYNGAWTTDRRRALTLRWREAAEAHAAHMRDRCPRNAELIAVEEIAAAAD